MVSELCDSTRFEYAQVQAAITAFRRMSKTQKAFLHAINIPFPMFEHHSLLRPSHYIGRAVLRIWITDALTNSALLVYILSCLMKLQYIIPINR